MDDPGSNPFEEFNLFKKHVVSLPDFVKTPKGKIGHFRIIENFEWVNEISSALLRYKDVTGYYRKGKTLRGIMLKVEDPFVRRA